MKRILTIVFAAVFAFALAGCASSGGSGSSGSASASSSSSAGSQAASASQVTVAIPVTSEPEAGFDPFFTWGCGEHVHEPLIQSTLIKTNKNLEFENDLATSYEVSADGLTWTFKIRGDVKFTDGQPLTAKDVAFTINGIKASEGSECDLSFVNEAVATDDTTVQIKLNKPFNALLYQLANIGIVPEHAHGADYGTNPIGSGRYKLEQWDRGQQAILVANPDYYGEAPKIDRVIVLFMEEDAALAAAAARRCPRRRPPRCPRRSRAASRAVTTCSRASRLTRAASRCRSTSPAARRATASRSTLSATPSRATWPCARP